MLKKISGIFLLMALILVNVMPSSAYADTSPSINSITNEDYIEIDANKYIGDNEALNSKIDDAIESADHIRIVNIDKAENNMQPYTSYFDSGNRELIPQSAAGYIVYDVRNVTALSNSYGSDYLNVSGAPGITIGLADSRTKSYSITFGATYGCSTNLIANAAWGTSSARTLTYSGTWKVPSTHNGKKVKRGHLHMRPEYKNKQYKVYSMVVGYTGWQLKGTSTTKRANAVDIYKTFTYK